MCCALTSARRFLGEDALDRRVGLPRVALRCCHNSVARVIGVNESVDIQKVFIRGCVQGIADLTEESLRFFLHHKLGVRCGAPSSGHTDQQRPLDSAPGPGSLNRMPHTAGVFCSNATAASCTGVSGCGAPVRTSYAQPARVRSGRMWS
jgi:hypothetical protein